MEPHGLLGYLKGSVYVKAFEFGRLVATRRVWELADTNARFNRFVGGCLSRYAVNDWGELDPEDWKLNDEAVLSGEDRILASYPLPVEFLDYVDFESKLWIITDADHKATTILFPGDY